MQSYHSSVMATSGTKNYDLMYYLKGAAAGGICCSITHGALTPVDVVKTRVQLDPVKVCGLRCCCRCRCSGFEFTDLSKRMLSSNSHGLGIALIHAR